VAGFVAIVGLVAGIAWGYTVFTDYRAQVDAFDRAQIPGAVTVTVERAGERVVYLEGRRDAIVPDLQFSVTGPDGSRIAVQDYAGNLRYDTSDGHVGRAVATFDATPGVYLIRVAGAAVPGAKLAVGEGVAVSSIAGVVGALFVIGGALSFALALTIVTAVQRTRNVGRR